MIKFSKKLLVFILAAIMMQSTLLVSCSSDTGDETTKAGTESSETETSAETETETEAETEPEETYDLGAMEFNMCSPDPAAMTWANPIMDAVEITGEPLNDAIYERNRGLEKKLNIVIKETYTDDIWGPNLLRSIVTATSHTTLSQCLTDFLSPHCRKSSSYHIKSCRTLTLQKTTGAEIC